MTRTPSLRRPAPAPGFTLVELMISLLIGFAVVGALLAAYMASYRSTTHNDALSEVTEDATLALNAIRAQAAMAGYSTPYSIDHVGQVMHGHAFPPVFGCAQSGFASPFAGITAAQPCTAAGSSTSDTLEVAYEANDSSYAGGPSNAVLNAAGQPLDCLGNAFAKLPQDGGYYLADSKFFVANDRLYCQGPGDMTAGAPLVDNVEQLSVRFGWGSQRAADGSWLLGAYIPAPPAVPTAPGTDWDNVLAVSVCVVVHSTTKVIDPDGTKVNPLGTYIDCGGQTKHSADGLLRRSFSTTIVLQNKLM